MERSDIAIQYESFLLFLLPINRVPVILVSLGTRLLALAAAVAGRCIGGFLADVGFALGLCLGFDRLRAGCGLGLRRGRFFGPGVFWRGVGLGLLLIVAGHRRSSCWYV